MFFSNVTIEKDGNIYQQGEKIVLPADSSQYLSSKRVSDGSWYFELTHYEGKGAYSCGFFDGSSYVLLYPEGGLSNPLIWLSGDLMINHEQNRYSIPFSINSVEHTVGIALDLTNYIFSIFYKNNFYELQLPKLQVKSEFEWECSRGNIGDHGTDIVSINFGSLPFKYHIPNITPWNEPQYINSYNFKANDYLLRVYLFIFLL